MRHKIRRQPEVLAYCSCILIMYRQLPLLAFGTCDACDNDTVNETFVIFEMAIMFHRVVSCAGCSLGMCAE